MPTPPYIISKLIAPGSPFTAALAEWTASDKAAFVKWYSKDLHTQREQDIKAQRTIPAMKPQEYVDALKAVDFISSQSIRKFMRKTQMRDWQPYPQPVILGSDADVSYQLCSELDCELEPHNDLPSNTPPSDYIIEIRAADNKIPSPVKYVFPLGRLEAVLSGPQTG